MKIRMITTASGPNGTFLSGREYDVPAPQAAEWIKGGSAQRVAGDAAAPAPREAATDPAGDKREKRGE